MNMIFKRGVFVDKLEGIFHVTYAAIQKKYSMKMCQDGLKEMDLTIQEATDLVSSYMEEKQDLERIEDLSFLQYCSELEGKE